MFKYYVKYFLEERVAVFQFDFSAVAASVYQPCKKYKIWASPNGKSNLFET